MSSQPQAEASDVHGCRVELRRVDGPVARELYFACRPVEVASDAGAQAEAVTRAISAVLEAEGGSDASLVRETFFLRSVRDDLGPVRVARERVLSQSGGVAHRPARLEIEQPPLDVRSRLAVSGQAIVSMVEPPRIDFVAADPVCGCASCVTSGARRARRGDELRVDAGALYGSGDGAYEETLAMFGVAEALLAKAGLTFRDVARTWIHLRDIDRDYAAFNRGRREFFASRGIDAPPASTGIGGAPVPPEHQLCLGLHAISRSSATERSPMATPTLNDASQYGADFVRGMRVQDANKVALHVSGTASIDESGASVHADDLGAQVDRMLLNLSSLLEGQQASFRDVVSAVTYVKRRDDAAQVRERLRAAGFEGFPNVLVEAGICRPELLCEAELLAVVPARAAIR